MPTTSKARSMPTNYDTELYGTAVRLCMSDKTMKDFVKLIEWYYQIYVSYVMFLWKSITVDGNDKIMKSGKYYYRYVKNSRNKPKLASRTAISRILYYVWKTFIENIDDIYNKKFNTDIDNSETLIIQYIDSLLNKRETDVPLFTTKNKAIVFGKYAVGLEDLYDGIIKLPKYGNIHIYQKDMKHLPELDHYIQAISILDPTVFGKEYNNFGINNYKVCLVPCMIYYNKPNVIFDNIRMMRHLAYYERLGLIDTITFSLDSNDKPYCKIGYYKTLKDKKDKKYTVSDLHDVILGLNMNDLQIIRKYADRAFKCKNDYTYDISIKEDGNVSISFHEVEKKDNKIQNSKISKDKEK